MEQPIQQGNFEDSFAIHQHYIEILNCVPSIVYWIDSDCHLQGCNHHFLNMLGLKSTHDLHGTPYEQMEKFMSWPKERIDSFKLDDMKVIFSGEAQLDIDEAPLCQNNQEPIWFRSRRVPLYDNERHVIGLVVVLTDVSEQKKLQTSLDEKTKQSSPTVNNQHEKTATPHVLMVEDNQVAQKVEESLLAALDCQVDIAESGDKALKLFKPGKYDIVFMDIGLKDTSGYLVAKHIRQLEENTDQHVPIIALTSYDADNVKNDCKDYQMEGVLTKPLTSEQAEQIIQRYVYQENVSVTGLRDATDEL